MSKNLFPDIDWDEAAHVSTTMLALGRGAPTAAPQVPTRGNPGRLAKFSADLKPAGPVEDYPYGINPTLGCACQSGSKTIHHSNPIVSGRDDGKAAPPRSAGLGVGLGPPMPPNPWPLGELPGPGGELCIDPPAYCLDDGDGDITCRSCPCYTSIAWEDAYYPAITAEFIDAYSFDRAFTGEDDASYADDATDSGAAVNGAVVTDPLDATTHHADVYFTVPTDLADNWDAEFFQSATGVWWTWAHVGTDGSACQSELLSGNYRLATEGGYVASGVQPYVVYSVLSSEENVVYRSYRVRVWIGLSHHFSIFLPPPDRSSVSAPYDTTILFDYDAYGGTMWALSDSTDSLSGDVEYRGRLADMFTGLIDRVTFQVAVPYGSGWSSRLYAYSCDPTQNYGDPSSPYLQNSYQKGTWNGYPAPNAFSNPEAKEETSDESAEMTAFLGATAWGDVCIMSKPDQPVPTELALARKAFSMLFGDSARVAYQLNGRGATATTEPDFVVNRWFRLTSSMLQSVRSFKSNMSALRSTNYGRYVFRDWDSARMQKDALKSRHLGCTCVGDEFDWIPVYPYEGDYGRADYDPTKLP